MNHWEKLAQKIITNEIFIQQINFNYLSKLKKIIKSMKLRSKLMENIYFGKKAIRVCHWKDYNQALKDILLEIEKLRKDL